MKNLTEIELEIRIIAKQIEAPEQYLPTFGYTEGTARPHIETQGNEFHYVINERGEEYRRVKTEDFKELTFLVFTDVTFEMSVKMELENRMDNEDFRIQMFQIQEDLLNKIDPSYSERLKVKHDKLLNRK
jgi:hypothetical protein